MEHDKFISQSEGEHAKESPLGLHIAQPEMSVAPWFQEEVRRELEKRFGTEQVHEAGLKVQTSLDLDLQQTANRAVNDGLATYERRHGWTGKLENILNADSTLDNYRHPDWALKSRPGDYVHAVVTSVLPFEIRARIGPTGVASDSLLLLPEDWKWTGIRTGDSLARPGDIVYVHLSDAMEGATHRATLEQDSGAQGALMAVDNTTGDVLAMVGGRDYALSQFNRATQAERQTGSSFKPYVYTAAVEDGAKPTDIIVDAPVSFGDYSPHNYEGDYKGSMTLLSAFAESRNIPALKLAARVGIHKVIDMAHRFGVTSNIPAYLPVALGAVEITLEEQVASYSVFPNEGVRVTPRLVRKVSNADGITLWEAPPSINEVIDRRTAATMMTFLREVTAHGTGAEAAKLNHPLGGKTGTTSDFTDAWFIGFSPSVTCGVWVGFDSRQSLGEKETGAKAALPIWMTFMKQAIAGKDNEQFPVDSSDDGALKASATIPLNAIPSHGSINALAGAKGVVHPTVIGSRPVIAAPSGVAGRSSVEASGRAPRSSPTAPTTSLIVKPALRPADNAPSETYPPIQPPRTAVKPALPPH
jgi:penicillin-binding protein 1A